MPGGRRSGRRARPWGDGFRPGASETVLRLLRGEDLESVSRELGITAARVSQWRDQFLAAGQASLKSRAPDARDEDNLGCKPRSVSCCGERLLYAKVSWRQRPFGPTEVDAMRGAQSIPRAGVRRVLPRVARALRLRRRQATTFAARLAVLVGHIRRVLEASPFMAKGTGPAKHRVAAPRRSGCAG